MNRRRSGRIGVVVAAVALLIIPACSADGDDAPSAADERTTTTAPLPTTTLPTDPAVYASTLDRLIGEVEASRGDLCALRGIAEGASAAGSPTNAEQAEQAARFIGAVYGAIGEAATDRSDGAIIAEAAAGIPAEPNAPGFDLQRFLDSGPSVFSDDDFRGAVQRVLASTETLCGRPTTTTTG